MGRLIKGITVRLYTYFRSSAAYRVRIALGLKDLEWEAVPVHLVRDGGQQHTDHYKSMSPAGLVPVLEDGNVVLNQSLAIIEYLNEQYSGMELLPGTAIDKAHIRALALSIACDTHPINNLRILKYLENVLQVGNEQRTEWYLHWVKLGLESFEKQLALHAPQGKFCYGNTPTLADVCLIPQVFNARRFGYDIDHLPRIQQVVQACSLLPAFIQAEPANQMDAD